MVFASSPSLDPLPRRFSAGEHRIHRRDDEQSERGPNYESPTTAMPIDRRLSDPAPSASAMGRMPRMVERLVMSTGRKRDSLPQGQRWKARFKSPEFFGRAWILNQYAVGWLASPSAIPSPQNAPTWIGRPRPPHSRPANSPSPHPDFRNTPRRRPSRVLLDPPERFSSACRSPLIGPCERTSPARPSSAIATAMVASWPLWKHSRPAFLPIFPKAFLPPSFR